MNISDYQQADTVRTALEQRRIAVVGLSPNPSRDSHQIAKYLLQNGYEVVPVNPRVDEVLGMKSYATLSAIPEPVDVVDVFRASDAVPEIAEDAVQSNAKYLWLQYDVISPEGVAIAEAGGMQCIVDLCIKVEHARMRTS